MTRDPEGKERGKLQDRLRFWISVAAAATLFGSYLFDIVDDVAMGNHWQGPPMWLVGIVTGILFGTVPTSLFSKFKKE